MESQRNPDRLLGRPTEDLDQTAATDRRSLLRARCVPLMNQLDGEQRATLRVMKLRETKTVGIRFLQKS